MKMIQSNKLVQYECPNCGYILKDVEGKEIDCPKCNEDFKGWINSTTTTYKSNPNFSLTNTHSLEEKQSKLEKGFLCPRCGEPTNTFRHMYAKRWCPSCDYILREEGDTRPYVFKDHYNKLDNSLK